MGESATTITCRRLGQTQSSSHENEVSVNGARKPLLHANLLFRGVEVPAGKSTVEFRFEPLSMENLVAAASNLLSSDAETP